METNEVHILTLVYDINFNDSDEGDSYAGEGCKILSVHTDRANAEAIAFEYNPVFSKAEEENTVYPVQKYNHLLKQKFGFTVHDIDDGYDFKLSVETFDVDVMVPGNHLSTKTTEVNDGYTHSKNEPDT